MINDGVPNGGTIAIGVATPFAIQDTRGGVAIRGALPQPSQPDSNPPQITTQHNFYALYAFSVSVTLDACSRSLCNPPPPLGWRS